MRAETRGAVIAGFVNRAAPTPQDALHTLGYIVLGTAFCAIAVRFSLGHKSAEQALFDAAVVERKSQDRGNGAMMPAE